MESDLRRIQSGTSSAHAIRVLACLWFAAAALLGGCGGGRGEPDGLDLSRVPLAPDLAAELSAGRRGAFAGDAAAVHSLRTYSRLLALIRDDAARIPASDELYALWAGQPDDPLLLELAVTQNRVLRRSVDLNRMLSRPGMADTNTAWGSYVAGRTAKDAATAARHLGAAARMRVQLAPLQRSWLQRRLADAAEGTAGPDSAVALLVAGLPDARRAGGPTLEMWFWHDLADYLIRSRRLDDALHAADLAAALSRKAGDEYRYQYAMSRVGKVLALRGEDEAALAVFAACAEVSSTADYQVPCALSLEGGMALHVRRGEYAEAIAVGQRRVAWDMAHRDTNNAIGALGSVAKYFYAAGEQDSCDHYMARTRELLAAYPRPSTMARMIPHLAYYHFQRGEFAVVDSLLSSNLLAGDAEDSANARAATLLMAVYHNLEMGRPEEVYRAIARLRIMAPTLYEDLPDQDKRADLQLTLAGFYAAQGEFILATDALDVVGPRILAGNDRYQQWRYQWELGKLAFLRDDLNGARRSFAACLDLANELNHVDLRLESAANLGRTLLAQDDVTAARALLESEVALAGTANFKACLSMRIHLADCFRRLGEPALARDYLSETAAMITRQPPVRLLAELRLQQGKVAADLGKATEAREYLLSARRGLADAGRDAPQAMDTLGDDLDRRIVEALIGLHMDRPALTPAGELGLSTVLLADACRWSSSPLADRTLDPARLRNWLSQSHDPVVAYFVGHERSFGWTLTNGKVTLFALPGRRELTTLMGMVLAGTLTPGQPVDHAALATLADRLLAPVVDAWPEGVTLRIVPDRGLHMVPWAALPVNESSRVVAALDHGPMTEAPSLAALLAVAPGRAGTHPGSLLAVGVDDVGGESLSPRLREAEAEAREIADLWPSSQSTDLRLGRDASWRQLSALDLKDYDVIHLATHIEMMQGVADRSTMRLYQGDSSEPLSINDVGKLALSADLVFLSGCEAARHVSGGGGLVDFSRAFLQAGAQAVIAPSVRIDDEAARQMATAFYRHYIVNDNRAASLRAALIDLRSRDPRWSHPAYWAYYHLLEGG